MIHEKIILYSTHCPKCGVLEKKLQRAELDYEICSDAEKMKERGLTEIPMIEIEGQLYRFSDACSWISSYVRENR